MNQLVSRLDKMLAILLGLLLATHQTHADHLSESLDKKHRENSLSKFRPRISFFITVLALLRTREFESSGVRF